MRYRIVIKDGMYIPQSRRLFWRPFLENSAEPRLGPHVVCFYAVEKAQEFLAKKGGG